MPKIELTPELSEKLKMERLNSKITAVELAKKLEISTGRLSNIENCKVKEVELGLFNKIINELIPKSKRKDYIDTLLNDTVVRFSKKDIERQDWFTIFDLQMRRVEITPELIDWLKITCEDLSISPQAIMTIVNENNIKDMTHEELTEFKKAEPNQLYIKHHDDNSVARYIRFELPIDLLDKIINKDILDIGYIFMAGIVNAFTQIPGKYFDTDPYSILYNHKFYTIQEKRKLITQQIDLKTFDTTIPTLSKTENIYIKHKNDLLKHLDRFNDFDALKANKRLEALNNNFNSDPGFTLTFCTLPLDKLKDLDKSTKLNFLKEIKDRIDSLAENAKTKEKIEEYDI